MEKKSHDMPDHKTTDINLVKMDKPGTDISSVFSISASEKKHQISRLQNDRSQFSGLVAFTTTFK